MKLLSFFPLSLVAIPCTSFQNPAGFSSGARSASTVLRAVNPTDAMMDLHTLLASPALAHLADAAAATLTDPPTDMMDMVTSSLSDGASALVDTSTMDASEVADAAAKTGWWASYLNLFKNGLLFIHDGIDKPLRDIGITQTWGISIALFTASIRSLLIPLSFQQSKSTEYVKALKPYMAEIKEKFKNNQDAQNRAVAKLYEDAQQNPFAGCLVSLAQLPIFLGLYRGVRLLAIDGELDERFLWIPSLQGPVSGPDFRGLDWLTSGWVDGAPQMGWETTIAFLIMPVLLVLGQSLSMRVLTPPVDENASAEEKEQMEKSQVVLKFLPLLIGFFSLQVPAGLTIYWFTSNGFTLAQSLGVRAYYAANPPKIELPDYWDALDDLEAMSPDEKRAAAKAGLAVGPNWEEILDEAKFHVVVDRKPLRVNDAAWQRIANMENRSVPSELQAWAVVEEVAANGKDHDSAPSEGAASPKLTTQQVSPYSSQSSI